MKSISLSFTPLPHETTEYMRYSEAPYMRVRIRRMIIPFALCCLMGLLINFYICVCSLCFFAVNTIVSVMLNKNNIKALEKSPVAVRNQTVDFYEDHVEITLHPDMNFKGTTVKHVPLKAVFYVLEGRDCINFITKSFGAVTVPKRILSEQDEEKIRNLIDNLFSDKYKKITD